GAADLTQILPELRERLPELPQPRRSEAEEARFRLFDAVSQLLRRAGGRRPIVLFLDDLHAADAPSLLLLRYVARELAQMRLLVVAACRDVDPLPGEQLSATLAELARERATTRISLRGLSEQAIGEYLEASASSLASQELIGALHEQT